MFVSYDLETHLITREQPAPKPVCLAIAGEDGRENLVVGDAIAELAYAVLSDETKVIVNHNIAFDNTVLVAHYPELWPAVDAAYQARRITDTNIRQQVWDIGKGRIRDSDATRTYSLLDLAALVNDSDLSKWKAADAWRYRYAELDGLPLRAWPKVAREYPLVDVRETLAIAVAQEKHIADWLGADYGEAEAEFWLRVMVCRGVYVDRERLEDVAERQREVMREVAPELRAAGLLEHNKRTGKYTKKMNVARQMVLSACLRNGDQPLLTDAGIKLEMQKPGSTAGKDQWKYVSCDAAACVLADTSILHMRRRYVTAEKILTTYAEKLMTMADGPVTTRYQRATTYRTTSSAPSAPLQGTNLQNMPREGDGLRSAYVPRDGWLFLAADFASVELHMFAQKCKEVFGYSTLGEALKVGQDPHLRVGSSLLGITYDRAKELLAAGDSAVKEARGHGKVANYGFLGLMRERTLQRDQLKYGNKIPIATLSNLRDVWLREWPEVPEYFDYVYKMLRGGQWVMDLWPGGPKRTVTKATVAANSGFQPRAAYGGKRALVAVNRACLVEDNVLNGRVRPVLWVHDELIAEMRAATPDTLDACAREYARIMASALNEVIPDYPTTADPVIMRRWDKNAKTVFDSKGRVTVWEEN